MYTRIQTNKLSYTIKQKGASGGWANYFNMDDNDVA